MLALTPPRSTACWRWAIALAVLSLACGAEGAGTPAAGGSGAAVAGAAGVNAGMSSGGGSSAGAVGSTPGPTVGGVSVGGGAASGASSQGGSGGAAGGLALCGEPVAPEPEPATPPSSVALDAGATTTLNAGNFDDAATNVLAASAAAGVQQGSRSNSTLWQWAQAGAWLEYTVEAVKAGSYSVVVMYYSAEPGGIATISVDGSAVGVARFGARDVVGEYGGVPGCCSRGHGVMARLSAGSHKIRVSVSPRSVPLDVYGLQLNFAGQQLSSGGKVHVLPAESATTALPTDGVADFYRMNFSAEKQAWPCEKSFCRVEYLVQPEQAGRYAVSMHYTKHNAQCMGVGFQLEDESLAVFRLDQAATVTRPVEMDLPCGVSRISIRDPNYVDGEFCSFGAMFGVVELARVE